MSQPTQQLASLVVGTSLEDLPPEIVHEARRGLLDFVGCALIGSRFPDADIIAGVVQEQGGAPQASVIGRGFRTSALNAALVNGTLGHLLDYDDTQLETKIHATTPTAAAILALAEANGRSGRDVLLAYVLGYEVAVRAVRVVAPSHYDFGWHVTGSAGVFGAAAGAGRLLGLDASTLTMALGVAATQSSGFRENFGTMSKPFHAGKAAMNGLLAALLASRGFTASPRVFESEIGWASATSDDPKPERLVEAWGERWAIARNSIKPYACGLVSHPVIDACLVMRSRHGVKPADVASIALEVHELALRLTGKPEPTTGLEGKFSIFHCAAIALTDGQATEDQFTDERVRDPQIVALRRLASATIDPELKQSQAVIRLTTGDGRTIVERVEAQKGIPQNPLDDAELEAKFRANAEPVLGPDRARQVAQQLWTIDQAASVAPLLGLLG